MQIKQYDNVKITIYYILFQRFINVRSNSSCHLCTYIHTYIIFQVLPAGRFSNLFVQALRIRAYYQRGLPLPAPRRLPPPTLSSPASRILSPGLPPPCLPPQNSWIFRQKVNVMSTSNLRSIGIYLRKCILPVVDLLVLVLAQSMSGYGELQFKCSKIVKNALYLRKNTCSIMHEC